MNLEIEPIKKLKSDLRIAAKTLGPDEARFLVSTYYTIQDDRKRSAMQSRILKKQEKPNLLLNWLEEQNQAVEDYIKIALDVYSANNEVGKWARDQKGIGPVIAAGLLAHIDIVNFNTAGEIWSFAGLAPGVAWLGGKAAEKAIRAFVPSGKVIYPHELIFIAKGLECDVKWLARRVYRNSKHEDLPFKNLPSLTDAEYIQEFLGSDPFTLQNVIDAVSKRPWNADLKLLCWKIGESFVKVSNIEDAFYGKIYQQRKALETAKNTAGDYKSQADSALKHFIRETDAKKAYSSGILPPAHIHSRAKRYAVKIFLSHYFDIAYRLHHKKPPPMPFAISHLNHTHFIEPPA